MTDEELDRLAALIAETLEKGGRAPDAQRREAGPWLPVPVRPEPPSRGGEPPTWSGAGQSLGDVAPIREPSQSRHRVDPAEMSKAVRAAAAGKAPPPSRPGKRTEPASRRRAHSLPVPVTIGVSNRHLHISSDDLRTLFGTTTLTSHRALKQPGQFAAVEAVTIVGPNGGIEGVRIVGPARGATQVELARSDAASLGIDPPLAASGSLDHSAGGVTLIGPHGRLVLEKGVIIAARHLHLTPADAQRWGLRDGDRVSVKCGIGARATTFHDCLVRSGPTHATEVHLDVDEARAAGVTSGDPADVVAWREGGSARRPLLTERDVVALAAQRQALPARALLTPSARDRARSLGLLE